MVNKSIEEREIVGFEGYTISNDGIVYSTKRGKKKPLKYSKDKDGYYRCVLHKNGEPFYFRINRLVALTFIFNPDNFPMVNHKDGNKQNNYHLNLEWTTAQGNNDHAIQTGLHSLNIPIIQKSLDGVIIAEYYSTREAEKATKIDGSHISKVCKGNRKTAGGFLWSYKNNK